jgi:hypothetical protein
MAVASRSPVDSPPPETMRVQSTSHGAAVHREAVAKANSRATLKTARETTRTVPMEGSACPNSAVRAH